MKTSRKILIGIVKEFDESTIYFHDITWDSRYIMLIIKPYYIYIAVKDGETLRDLCKFDRQTSMYTSAYIEYVKLSKIIRQIIIALDVQFHVNN